MVGERGEEVKSMREGRVEGEAEEASLIGNRAK